MHSLYLCFSFTLCRNKWNCIECIDFQFVCIHESLGTATVHVIRSFASMARVFANTCTKFIIKTNSHFQFTVCSLRKKIARKITTTTARIHCKTSSFSSFLILNRILIRSLDVAFKSSFWQLDYYIVTQQNVISTEYSRESVSCLVIFMTKILFLPFLTVLIQAMYSLNRLINYLLTTYNISTSYTDCT